MRDTITRAYHWLTEDPTALLAYAVAELLPGTVLFFAAARAFVQAGHEPEMAHQVTRSLFGDGPRLCLLLVPDGPLSEPSLRVLRATFPGLEIRRKEDTP
jgi:hypothetical protein